HRSHPQILEGHRAAPIAGLSAPVRVIESRGRPPSDWWWSLFLQHVSTNARKLGRSSELEPESKKNSRHRGVQQRGSEPNEQGPQSKCRQVVAALRRNGANPTDLNSDRREIGEARQRERCQQVRAIAHVTGGGFPSFHHEISIVFIDGQLGPEKAAHF